MRGIAQDEILVNCSKNNYLKKRSYVYRIECYANRWHNIIMKTQDSICS